MQPSSIKHLLERRYTHTRTECFNITQLDESFSLFLAPASDVLYFTPYRACLAAALRDSRERPFCGYICAKISTKLCVYFIGRINRSHLTTLKVRSRQPPRNRRLSNKLCCRRNNELISSYKVGQPVVTVTPCACARSRRFINTLLLSCTRNTPPPRYYDTRIHLCTDFHSVSTNFASYTYSFLILADPMISKRAFVAVYKPSP